ncbi:cyclic nucleotide-binding domain-containing protein [Enterococcus sp. AZ149]|uniref:cyclic nucleotide-binding domain-containing protein n=1 Tax=Enterococcus sp. AZ149 TaxID=2774686 RepID=UPI003F21143D
MKKTAYALAIKQVPIKESCPLPIPEEILQQSALWTFDHREAIQKETMPMSVFFVLLTGKAKIIQTQENGKRALLQFLHPGDCIGDLTLIGAETVPKTVVAIGETTCLGIPMKAAAHGLMQDLAFVQTLGKTIGEKLLLRMDHFSVNQTYPLAWRLAQLLLEASIDELFQEKLTETAEYLGVSYRHLTYTLKDFKTQKLVIKTEDGYRIDAPALQTFIQNQQKQ